MKLSSIVAWLDETLNVKAFDDVSNNGLQLVCRDQEVKRVAFAVDASVRAVKAAAEAGARMLVVHHGISWGGGIRRLDGGVYEVVRAALESDLALYACHLPLDAHPVLGNNARLARLLKLRRVKKEFSYHGNVIGLVGTASRTNLLRFLGSQHFSDLPNLPNLLVGICSGGAGEFAEEAKNLGCDLFITGEANWGDRIAAENLSMPMVCLGHYATEVWGVRAVSEAMPKALRVQTVDLTERLA